MKTTNTKDFTTMIMEKKEMLSILEELMTTLGRMEDSTRREWRSTGEQEQRTSWNKEAEESQLVWLDEDGKRTFENTGVPCMMDKYDDLPKLEYTLEDEAKLNAINKVRDTLASLA